MKYRVENKNIILENLRDFDLEETFECGQCFRWEHREDNSYVGVVFKKIISLSKNDNELIIKDTSEEDFKNIWTEYFDLNTDYSAIKNELANIHPTLKAASEFAPGIRILKQEPWETLCSFIISQNNNIPRIKGIINRLCKGFGERIRDDYYTFPNFDVLAGLKTEDLSELRSGFRAKYIIDAANKIKSGEVDFNRIKTMSIEEARNELMKIKGVGPKVAECTLLYGFYRTECFPLDVWMKRAMSVFFPGMLSSDFGKNAGIAQQYIFHYSRMNEKLLKTK